MGGGTSIGGGSGAGGGSGGGPGGFGMLPTGASLTFAGERMRTLTKARVGVKDKRPPCPASVVDAGHLG